jgi:hypothetical protein
MAMFWRGDHLPPIMRMPYRLAWLAAAFAVTTGIGVIGAWAVAFFRATPRMPIRGSLVALGIVAIIGGLAGANVVACRLRMRRRAIAGDYAVCGHCGHILAVEGAARCGECGRAIERERLRSFWKRFFPGSSGIGPPRSSLACARRAWRLPWGFVAPLLLVMIVTDLGRGRLIAPPGQMAFDALTLGLGGIVVAILVRRARCSTLAKHVRLCANRVCGDCATQITSGTTRCNHCGREWDVPALVAQWDEDCPAHWGWEGLDSRGT